MRNEEYSKLVEDYKEILQYMHDEDLNKELIQLYVYNDLLSEDLTPEELLIANEIKKIRSIIFLDNKEIPLNDRLHYEYKYGVSRKILYKGSY